MVLSSIKANNKSADQSAQAGLRLYCSPTPEDRFSRLEAQEQNVRNFKKFTV